MNINKLGFTLIELLGVVLILGILAGIAVPAVTQYLRKARVDTYINYEQGMASAAENYLTENAGKIPNINESITIKATDLIAGRYLDKLVDPESDVKGACDSSTVIVTRNANLENIGLKYKTCLICSKYRSEGC